MGNREGWENYETWAIKLHIDNEESSYEAWTGRAGELIDDDGDTVAGARGTLADELKAEHEEAMPELEGFAADLLNAAFGEVNWYEIAEAMLRAAIENREYEKANA